MIEYIPISSRYITAMLHLGMTNDEYRTMFALWCMVKSPLMLGSDLTLMTREDEAYKIITNKWLLAVNQDELGYL